MKARLFKRYRGFFKSGAMTWFAYRFSTISWIIAITIQTLCSVLLYYAVYNGDTEAAIYGFQFKDLVTYLITVSLVSNTILNQDSFWVLGTDIREGDIAINLTKPINYRLRLFFGQLGTSTVSFLVLFVPIYLVAVIILHFTIGSAIPLWYNIIFFLISVTLSFVIMDSISFLFGQLAYLTASLFGAFILWMAIFQFCSGMLIPLSFMPEWASNTLRILPFSSIAETPVYIMLDMYSIAEIGESDIVISAFAGNGLASTGIKLGFQLAWAAVFMVASFWANRISNKHVVSAGG